jgi:phosphoribosylformylglycinamidine synthase
VERCEYHGVELADLGEFTGDRVLTVRSGGVPVLELTTDFLHDGRPQRRMSAVLPQPDRRPTARSVDDPATAILRLLAHRNIASKASTIHRYDHEILGSTVVRPLVGRLGDAHADGIVLAEPGATDGIAVGIGTGSTTRSGWPTLQSTRRSATS